jgi:hypothetical protein
MSIFTVELIRAALAASIRVYPWFKSLPGIDGPKTERDRRRRLEIADSGHGQ